MSGLGRGYPNDDLMVFFIPLVYTRFTRLESLPFAQKFQ